MNAIITTGSIVNVNGSAYGVIQYVTADGFYGVTLLGETRTDEWHPSQIMLADAST